MQGFPVAVVFDRQSIGKLGEILHALHMS